MLQVYKPHGITDALLFHVHQRMLADGDFEHRFAGGLEILSAFYASFQEPAITLYAQTGNGALDPIWCLVWLQPLTVGAVQISIWIAPEYRTKRRTLRAVLAALEVGLQMQPVVLGVTIQARLLKEYARLGFQRCGVIPGLLRTCEPVHVWYLTREAFAETKARYARLAEAA